MSAMSAMTELVKIQSFISHEKLVINHLQRGYSNPDVVFICKLGARVEFHRALLYQVSPMFREILPHSDGLDQYLLKDAKMFISIDSVDANDLAVFLMSSISIKTPDLQKDLLEELNVVFNGHDAKDGDLHATAVVEADSTEVICSLLEDILDQVVVDDSEEDVIAAGVNLNSLINLDPQSWKNHYQDDLEEDLNESFTGVDIIEDEVVDDQNSSEEIQVDDISPTKENGVDDPIGEETEAETVTLVDVVKEVMVMDVPVESILCSPGDDDDCIEADSAADDNPQVQHDETHQSNPSSRKVLFQFDLLSLTP